MQIVLHNLSITLESVGKTSFLNPRSPNLLNRVHFWRIMSVKYSLYLCWCYFVSCYFFVRFSYFTNFYYLSFVCIFLKFWQQFLFFFKTDIPAIATFSFAQKCFYSTIFICTYPMTYYLCSCIELFWYLLNIFSYSWYFFWFFFAYCIYYSHFSSPCLFYHVLLICLYFRNEWVLNTNSNSPSFPICGILNILFAKVRIFLEASFHSASLRAIYIIPFIMIL